MSRAQKKVAKAEKKAAKKAKKAGGKLLGSDYGNETELEQGLRANAAPVQNGPYVPVAGHQGYQPSGAEAPHYYSTGTAS